MSAACCWRATYESLNNRAKRLLRKKTFTLADLREVAELLGRSKQLYRDIDRMTS